MNAPNTTGPAGNTEAAPAGAGFQTPSAGQSFRVSVSAGTKNSVVQSEVSFPATPQGMADALNAMSAIEEAWWSPHVFESVPAGACHVVYSKGTPKERRCDITADHRHRRAEHWAGSGLVALDLDLRRNNEDVKWDADEVSRAARERFVSLMQSDPLGNVAHLTPKGARVVFVLTVFLGKSQEAEWEAAARGASALAQAWLKKYGLLDVGLPMPALKVDPVVTQDRARLLYTPRSFAKGVQRSDTAFAISPDIKSPQALASFAPASGASTKRPPRPAGRKSQPGAPAADSVDEAVQRFNEDWLEKNLPTGWARFSPNCPFPHCGTKSGGNFGPSDKDETRWVCWSANHLGGGRLNKDRTCFTGDALDYAMACEDVEPTPENRVAYLRELRYLPDKGQDEGHGDSWWTIEKHLRMTFPVLEAHFRRLLAPDGTARVYRLNDRKEVALQVSESAMVRVLSDELEKHLVRTPPESVFGPAIKLWERKTTLLTEEPEPFVFAGDDRLSFKRFDWAPEPGPHPAWDEWLDRLSDPEAFKGFVWSIFVPDNASRQYLWLRGEGQDGKSVVLRTLAKVFGDAAAALNNLQVQAGRFMLSGFYGKRLVIYPDCKNAKFGMTEVVRNLTSGDPQAIEYKGQTPFTACLRTKLLVASNHRPDLTGQRADTSRCLYIEVAPTTNTDDPGWGDRLIRELPQFLATCREAYARVCPRGGDVLVNDATREAVRTAAVSFEEQFHELVERAGWVFEPGGRLLAGEVRDFCRQQGLNQDRIRDFKRWLETEHKVVYGRSNSVRFYLGMASRVHEAAARGKPADSGASAGEGGTFAQASPGVPQ